MRRKKVLIQSNEFNKNTGFAKTKKALLKHLYSLDKYEIVELNNGRQMSEKFVSPWRAIGTLPDNPTEIQAIQQQGGAAQQALSYGGFTIDKIIAQEVPDVYLNIEDPWAFRMFEAKHWWNQTTPVLWTTVDSLPLLEEVEDLCRATPNFFVWAKFAEEELHRKGLTNAKTVHGPIEVDNFFPLPDEKKKELRTKFGIGDNFIMGFVFRNQLRKSVPNLLQGFVEFKKKCPESKPKLLLHTSWVEGWNIQQLIEELGIDKRDILTTYVCANCGDYVVTHYQGEGCTCPYCKSQGSLNTTNINFGATEAQLNEIYSLMDFYIHPFTSGGQEIPIQEAKLTGLITAVTNYSCGEEYCLDVNGGLPLSWDEYREPGSQFIKATTDPKSIAYNMEKVWKMSPEKRKEMGRKAREWTLENFDIKKIGKVFEDIIDNAPFVEKIEEEKEEIRDLAYVPDQSLSDEDWVNDVLKNVLKRNFDSRHREGKKIVQILKQGKAREVVLDNLRKAGHAENSKVSQKPISFESLLDPNDKGRVAFVMPRSIGDVFLCTSLLESVKRRYPDKSLYFITDPSNFELLAGNPYVHRCIPYSQSIDNSLILEGQGGHKGFFDIAYRPHTVSQFDNNYSHNGEAKSDLVLK